MKHLSLAQQRDRLLALLAAERVKLAALERDGDRADAERAPLYTDLVARQQRVTEKLAAKIADLTNRLEAPALRQRLVQVEAAGDRLQKRVARLQKRNRQLLTALRQNALAARELSLRVESLQALNAAYVQDIAYLSLHAQQNAEDHARSVLLIARELDERGLTIPAKASARRLGDADCLDVLDEADDTADRQIDQTIFPQRFSTPETTYTLALVVNGVALDAELQPLEIRLTEFNRSDRQHRTRKLHGFPMAEAIEATECFAELCAEWRDRLAQSDEA